jgi:2',3'-cyclic-nucleotide 2'-phosphodiesterase (5'-nucleotidase family)
VVRLVHYSDVENAHDDPERIGRLVGLIRALDGPDALVLGAGDDTSPGVLALVESGGQAIPFFERAGTDVETFGNHDFDYGPERTLELVAASPQTWVSANVDRNGARFGADAGVEPWTTVAVDGARVGVFGVTAPETAEINPEATDLSFRDPVAAGRAAADDLRAAGADHVVALSHLGRGDRDLAASVDVDAVLGGHLHTEAAERVDGTPLTRPGVNGRAVYELDLAAGEVRRHPVAEAPVDERAADHARELLADAGLSEVVATVEEPIARDRAAAVGGESRVGNFVADAYRWYTGADVGFQNAGGIREGPALAGEVTVADLVSVVPFQEPVAVLEVDGAALRAALGEAGGDLPFGDPDWWHAHVSGATVTYDRERDELVAASVGGDPLDPDRTYTVASSAYVFGTEREFSTLTGRPVETGPVQYEVLAAFARECGLDPAVEGRVEFV